MPDSLYGRMKETADLERAAMEYEALGLNWKEALLLARFVLKSWQRLPTPSPTLAEALACHRRHLLEHYDKPVLAVHQTLEWAGTTKVEYDVWRLLEAEKDS